MHRTRVNILKNPPTIPLIAKRQRRTIVMPQHGIRITPILKNILSLRLQRPLRIRSLSRIKRIRRLERTPTHTSRAPPHSIRNINQPISRRIQTRFIEKRRRNRLPQTRLSRSRNPINPIHVRITRTTNNTDIIHRRLQQILQRPQMNHRNQLTPNIVNLIIRSRHNLNQRRRMTPTHRLTRQILPNPPTIAAPLATVINVTLLGPAKELRRPNRSQRNPRSSPRPLTHLLRRNHLRTTINKSLVQQRFRKIRLTRTLAHTPIIRRTPKLPIILTKRLTTLMPIRHTTMSLNPPRPQIPKRRKINNKLRPRHSKQPSYAA